MRVIKMSEPLGYYRKYRLKESQDSIKKIRTHIKPILELEGSADVKAADRMLEEAFNCLERALKGI